MRRLALFLLISPFLTSCGGVQPKEARVKIPLPADKSSVEPSVARLLNQTSSELRNSMEDPQKWLVHGSALFANAYYHESAESLRQAITLKSEMPQATYLLAAALWKANKQEDGIVALQAALVLIPEYDMGWRLLAEWQLERGETADAEVSARRAFDLNPGRIGTRYILAQSLMDDGKYEEALPFLEETISVKKAPRWIYTLASQCYRQLGMTEQSEEALLQSGPPFVDWPDPMYKHIPNLIAGKAELAEYAMHLYHATGPTKAKPFLIKAFKINPAHVNVRVALSIVLQAEGNLDQAKKLLEEMQGEPNSNYWKQYAGICIGRDELSEANAHISKALALDGEDANARDIAAVIANKQGNTAEASRQWEEAGKLYIKTETWDKAELSLAFAEENGELTFAGSEALALAQIEMGHALQARTTIQKLLKRDPSNEKALELQSRLPTE